MFRTSCAGLVIVSLCLAAGCADRGDVTRLKRELAEARAELKALREQPAAAVPGKDSYLDQLERLEVLKSKGVLTDEEFLAKKRAILAMPAPAVVPNPAPCGKPLPTLNDLDGRLREIQGLWNKNELNAQEYNDAKAKILKQPFQVVSLAKDLDKVQALWNQNLVNASEYNGLKQSVLQQIKTGSTRTVEELDGQLREVQALWNRSVLNASEYNDAKAKLLQQPLRGTDLSADLGRVTGLWNQNLINASEYNALKQKVLQLDVGK